MRRFENMEEALVAVKAATLADLSPWAMEHCAQSLEYAVTGFPQAKSRAFQMFIGRPASRIFLMMGRLKHPIDAPIPGAPEIEAKDFEAAKRRLIDAIRLFSDALPTRDLPPHFAYGRLSRTANARLQAFHIAEHWQSPK